ncbi:PREDICTED: uncharacterized protein LOC109588143 [Amphimedon queenslandica]|uniref:Uncharacterized protein n=1 Tax=Amphimedon queenslandica TaxID=400682 RepID=A0A1X7TF78_AMPQE|nr:PREDICTED: uncharacterized protein LOC109588143 [Amphimedon queenslandica]|eukprot:XP_019859882.1 PREDICTED: uncharacterized protein LOC109588143 [Amphimedon queenslandica]
MDRNVDEKDQYKFNWRARHTTAVIGEVLYCWGGDQGLNESECNCSGDFPKKREHISVIDKFDFSSGVWSSRRTSGTPPLGIRGVSCTTINNNIYYFGGFCGHGSCYHNSLNCLDTLTLQWKELQPTGDNYVTKRGYGGMIAMGSEGCGPQQLLVIGGLAPVSSTTHCHPQFKYRKIPYRLDRLSTNEQNIYNLYSGQWIIPYVIGQCFLPTKELIIEKISHNKGIMYGGAVHDGDISVPTNSIYLFEFSHNDTTINWKCLNKGSIPNDGLWSKERYTHASTIINGASTSPILVVIGGTDSHDKPLNECLLLDTNQYNWIQFPLPDSVTGRYYHTVSSFVVDPNHVFLIVLGGYAKTTQIDVGGGAIDWINTPVTNSHITMVVELVFHDGQWSVESVSSGMFRMNNQLLWEELLKIKSEKSLLETQLLETKTLLTKRKRDQEDSPHSNYSKKLKTNELEESVEEEQIMTDEDNEKLRATVAYNEVYITEIEEEKKQVEEHLQIIIDDLKFKLSEKDAQISKLMKEKSEKEAQAEKHLKEKQNKLDFLSDVQVAEKKLFLIQGDKPQLMNWEKYGLRIRVQEESLLSSETVEAAVVALVGGQFEFPPNTVLVSAVYAVSLSKPLLKRLKLEIQHCVDLTGQPDLAQYLKFAIAPVDTPSLPYQFSIVEGGKFRSNSGYGSIQRKEFSFTCILGEDSTNGGGNGVPIAPFNGDTEEGEEEEEEQQQQQGEEEEEEIQQDLQQKKDEGGNEDKGDDDDDDSSSDSSGITNKNSSIPEASGAAKKPINEKEFKDNEDKEQSSSTELIPHRKDKVQSTGVRKAVTYAGLVYYEEKGVEDMVTFTAAKNLEVLIQFIEQKHSQAEIGPDISFCFKFPYDYVELNLTAEQDEPFTGWILRPHTKPTRLYQEAIDKFGDKEHSRPSCCLISVYGSPDAVPFLNYFIPLEGVAHPVSLNIHRARRNLTVPVPPSTNPTTSSSPNVVHESTPLSTGEANAPSSSGNDETTVPTKRSREGGFDIKTAKQKIKDVMTENRTDFAALLQFSLVHVANKLSEVHMIPPEVQQSPTYDAIFTCFLSMMSLLDSKSDLEKHCVKYLEALSSVGGPIEFAANLLREKWTTALEGALEFEQSVKRVRTNDK